MFFTGEGMTATASFQTAKRDPLEFKQNCGIQILPSVQAGVGMLNPRVCLDGMICYSQILAERAANVSTSECTVSKLDLHFNVEKLGVSQACCKNTPLVPVPDAALES